MRKIKVIFFVPYPKEGASNRYRVNQYINFLEKHNIECNIRPFLSDDFYRIIYKKGLYFKKTYLFIKCTLKRIYDLFNARNYDVAFIQRECFPLGPPFFEEILNKMSIPLIYDFDDAIYIPDNPERKIKNILKNHDKIPRIIGLSNHIIVCNEYLKEYCLKYNNNITIIPTSVDTDRFSMKEYPEKFKDKNETIIIGWIGSHSTTKYLHQLTPVFEELSKKYKLKIIYIGANENFNISGVDIINKPWTLQNEVEDFKSFDIGVYPLDNDEWVLGKTGFKTIQYMSVGVPGVVSNVGTNKYIVKDYLNGIKAYNKEEWILKISELIENPELRRKISIEGRKTAVNDYSVKSNAPRILSTINRVYLGIDIKCPVKSINNDILIYLDQYNTNNISSIIDGLYILSLKKQDINYAFFGDRKSLGFARKYIKRYDLIKKAQFLDKLQKNNLFKHIIYISKIDKIELLLNSIEESNIFFYIPINNMLKSVDSKVNIIYFYLESASHIYHKINHNLENE